MTHRYAPADAEFRNAVENCALSAAEFDHAAHVRLAYIYLCVATVDDAHAAMRRSLRALLAHLGADPQKYHETLTRSWLLAVRHFMAASAPCSSAIEFTQRNPALLDGRLMLKHYSAEKLFSAEARAGFVEPDLAPIPRH